MAEDHTLGVGGSIPEVCTTNNFLLTTYLILVLSIDTSINKLYTNSRQNTDQALFSTVSANSALLSSTAWMYWMLAHILCTLFACAALCLSPAIVGMCTEHTSLVQTIADS